MSAMLKIETPESCVGCKVAVWFQGYFGDRRVCGLVGVSIDRYAESRHPDCPLVIAPETPDGELKPCPFCGENPIYIEHENLHMQMVFHKVQCENCETRTPWLESKLGSILSWNRRV